MAMVQGIRERVHWSLYDCLYVEPGQQLRAVESSSVFKFFVNVQNKTKLLTNLESASLLPHYNTFEARAMRVVISEFPGWPRGPKSDAGDSEQPTASTGASKSAAPAAAPRAVAPIPFTLIPFTPTLFTTQFIYTTVTTLFIGEKRMIQMPTWNFPGGAGISAPMYGLLSHGTPDPGAIFRFAEPIIIGSQQNFRVEIEVPDTRDLQVLQGFWGPLYTWVTLDGFMVRDVQ